jgi:hypothetical protein
MTSVGSTKLSSAPSFWPIPSLLGAPIADIDDVRRGDVCLVGLFEDHADATDFGARFAARQIRYASQGDEGPSHTSAGVRILDLGDLNVFPLERERNDSALMRQLKSIFGKGAVPVVVGGAFPMGPLMWQALEQETARHALLLDLPAAYPEGAAANDCDLIVLTIDLSRWDQLLITREKPLAHLRQAIEALSPKSIGAVHVTGLTPDLDLCGRQETSLGHHVLKIVVTHLRKADA